MSLVNRLAGLNNEAKIPVHYFYAALSELAAGEFTRAQIISQFGLVTDDSEAQDGTGEDETVALDVIITGYTNAAAGRKQEYLEFIHRLFMLAEAGAPGYTTKAALNARLSRF